MSYSTIESIEETVSAIADDVRRLRGVRTASKTPVPPPPWPAAYAPEPHVLEPGEKAVGCPISTWELVLGRVLWQLGWTVGAVGAVVFFLHGLGVVEGIPDLTLVGVPALLAAIGLEYAGDFLQERTQRRDALSMAEKQHQAVLEAYRAELNQMARAAEVRGDSAETLSAEMRALYRRRRVRMQDTGSALAQARADLRVIQAPMLDVLLGRWRAGLRAIGR